MTTVPRPGAPGDLYVAVVLDRSGSMEPIRSDTVEAYNGFLAGLQQQDGKTLVTLTQFDSEGIDIDYEAIPVAEVTGLTHATYVPRAMTPLLDAVGRTLARTEETIRRIPWTGEVLVAIITDGCENASREWTARELLERIKGLEGQGWRFMYLGAHADAFDEASAIGIDAMSAARWGKSRRGSKGMSRAMIAASYKVRSRAQGRALFDEADRDDMQGDDA